MNFEYIFLDADNTIFDFDKAEYKSLKHCFSKHNLSFTDEIYNEYHQINANLWLDYEKGLVSVKDLQIKRFETILASTDIDIESFNADFKNGLSLSSDLIDDALFVCENLSKYKKLYVITNGVTETQKKRFAVSPITKYFEEIFISSEIGYQKPDKRFFDHIIDKLNLDKNKILVIGDSLSSDIKGANNASLACCWFNPNKLNQDKCKIDFEINSLVDIFKILPCYEKGTYTHYKGNEYELIDFVRHSETVEDMILYKALYENNNNLWVRPINMWNDIVTVNGEKKLRFTFKP